MHKGFLTLYRNTHLFSIIFLIVFVVTKIHAVSFAEKYPSYAYVLSEFDIDDSYIYDEGFLRFVSTYENRLTHFYRHALKRGKWILPTMYELLLNDGMSDLFIYLSMIESGFKSDAVSTKKAVGLWQFMPKTAKAYKLMVSKTCDERYDVSSATLAAIRYLTKLHKEFGKWYLAIMAYNCGEGCLHKAIQKAGSDALYILTDDSLKYLPEETRLYIKKVLLLAMIGENKVLDFHLYDDNALIKVEVAESTSLKEMASLLKMDYNTLLNLNKGIYRGILPSVKKRYKINIPMDKIFLFYLQYHPKKQSVHQKTDTTYMLTYRVQPDDTLVKIAKMYETNCQSIININHLKQKSVSVNRLLVIPVSKEKFEKSISTTE